MNNLIRKIYLFFFKQKIDFEYLDFYPPLKKLFYSAFKNGSNQGLSEIYNLKIIRGIILKLNYSRTLEIGLANGASAITFLYSLNQNSNKEFSHTAIDPFQKECHNNSGVDFIKKEKLSKSFHFYEECSNKVLPELFSQGEKYELIYIDGSHRYEDIFIDFYYSSLILEIGGIILFDDSTLLDTYKVIKFIKKNFKRFFKEIDYKKFDKSHKSLIKKVSNKFGYKQLYGFEKIKEPDRDRSIDPLRNF
tara:strand:- start:408 stop:1151 length:744 start_codon:yes stop_codon:yes gene_type:complete